MDEHLFNTKEAAIYLGIDENKLKELVRKKIVPAYKIGGSFLRFRKDQLDIAASAIREPSRKIQSQTQGFEEDRLEKIRDFLYFNDFYIFSTVLVILAIIIIFTS